MTTFKTSPHIQLKKELIISRSDYKAFLNRLKETKKDTKKDTRRQKKQNLKRH